MPEAFICDGMRTPIGRYAGGLAQGAHRRSRRGADQGADEAAPEHRLVAARRGVSTAAPTRPARTTATSRAWRCCWRACRIRFPAITVNRLCASGLNAVGAAAQAIRAGEIDFAIAGGVESMTRAPLVMGKAQEAFQRSAQVEDTTIGWRFINPLMKKQYGVDAMPETAENVAEDYQVARKDQDALRAALAAARRPRRKPRVSSPRRSSR